jgi:hypothetical protein
VTRQVIAKRTKRHLDELEVGKRPLTLSLQLTSFFQRTNYAEPSISAFAGAEDDEVLDGKYGKGRARQTISDKRRVVGGAAVKKKSSMNVRTALLYRKNLATLIDESVSARTVSQCDFEIAIFHPGNRATSRPHSHLPDGSHNPSTGASQTVMHRLRLLGKV